MKAYRLSRVDDEYDMYLQAWLNTSVGATKMQGKKEVPVYKRFKDFFDYEKSIREIDRPQQKKLSERHRKMAQIASQINKKGG